MRSGPVMLCAAPPGLLLGSWDNPVPDMPIHITPTNIHPKIFFIVRPLQTDRSLLSYLDAGEKAGVDSLSILCKSRNFGLSNRARKAISDVLPRVKPQL